MLKNFSGMIVTDARHWSKEELFQGFETRDWKLENLMSSSHKGWRVSLIYSVIFDTMKDRRISAL